MKTLIIFQLLPLLTLSLLLLTTPTTSLDFPSVGDFFSSLFGTFKKKHKYNKIINVAEAPVGVGVAPAEEVEKLPSSFDARYHWPRCTSVISRVSTQGSCGSCWAVVTTDVVANRICIASKGTIQVRLSPMHLLQCCGLGECADGVNDHGACAGGDPWGAWRYFTEHGIVTERCKPYPDWVRWAGITTFFDGVLTADKAAEMAACQKQCSENSDENSGSLNYQKELYFGHSYYRLPMDEGTIRREIFEHGPVVTHISVDNPQLDSNYHDGSVIYRCPEKVGWANHGIRLIGWGEEKSGEKYWFAVNSWGQKWGNNGTFRIARGSNCCHVEEFVSAVIPKV